jgi:methionine synthase II (cobalamin-independent)
VFSNEITSSFVQIEHVVQKFKSNTQTHTHICVCVFVCMGPSQSYIIAIEKGSPLKNSAKGL